MFSLPSGYLATATETATADQHNEPLEDLESDANAARPITAGGTGATSAATALSNLGGMPIAGGTFTGAVKLKEAQETVVALSGTTPDVDLETGTVFTLTTSGNTTFTFSNPAATGTASGFTLRVTAGGTHTLTWPASVDWDGGTAPDAPASGETDVYAFWTTDGGTQWYGHLAGDAMA
ncbi:hypothetical protein [Phaeobacter gallaeciensis]|uniref:hypothetical protein n=1 Tax=Phaeobacter gallaeciensis TaxID=60890 RepID=UPI002380AC2B|nr:hypothetical protein [Phaeobacter gallaeciensis]MDE5184823.1 hypothetical protein [Phaeobacter gallaeciensis]